jgi:DNA helicase II / ATP-dependent DNA helicase PcrA
MLEEPFATLTPKQKEAVEHTSGPLLILAGAGTGKTTTITGKIAYLVEKWGVEPEKILALTFSREAARNMETKVRELLGLGANAVSARPLRAPCVEMKYCNTFRPSRKFAVMGVSMMEPSGLAIRPRMPASWRI